MHFANLGSAIALARAVSSVSIPQPSRSSMLDSHMVAALEALGKKPSDLRLPGSLPSPNQPAGTDLLPGIENIVILMFENHSYDSLLGTLDREGLDGLPIGEDGLPAPVHAFENGTLIRSYPLPMTCQRTHNTDSPTQNWASSHTQFNNGTNDGWIQANGNLTDGNKTLSMAFATESQVSALHSLAKVFPVCDRWHSSVLGPTWPNRMFAIGGTALGITATGQSLNGTVVPQTHSFFPTLDRFNISWRHYLPGLGQSDAISTFDRFPLDNATNQAHTVHRSQFFVDAAQGTLQPVSFIDVNGSFDSQEPPQNLVNGDALLFDVVQALGQSPQWEKCMLVMMYDEHGGYYDHASPPVALAPDDVEPITQAGLFRYSGYTRYGYRVPAFVVSPYAKKNHVVHTLHDHASILALIQLKYNLPAMTFRDANANDITDFIDLKALAKGVPNFPDIKSLNLSPAANTPENLACSEEKSTIILPPLNAYHEPTFPSPM